MNPWTTLYDCFMQNKGDYPFTVEWNTKDGILLTTITHMEDGKWAHSSAVQTHNMGNVIRPAGTLIGDKKLFRLVSLVSLPSLIDVAALKKERGQHICKCDFVTVILVTGCQCNGR